MPETTRELKIMFDNLTKTVEDGFESTHKRLDVTNGKVMTNTEFRIGAEAQLKTVKWLVGTIGLIDIITFIIK